MKTKKFDVKKELEMIAKKIGDDETMFAIYANDKKRQLRILTTDENDNDIICTIATILETSLTDKGDEGMDRVTNIIIESLKLVLGTPSIARLKLTTEMLKGIIEKTELLLDKDDDDDEEDCENCKFMRTCQNESAIAYRKANGIPKPKNGKDVKVEVN